MLFAEADAPHLRTWIISRLANTSDADADVLADYVLALLRHDGDVESIRKVFEEEIPDFLREDSAAFTDDVFQAVKYKSYLPGAPPAPPIVRKAPAAPVQAPQIPTGPAALQQPPYAPAYDVQHTPYSETPSAFSSYTVRNGSRKRSYRDLDAPDTQPTNWDYGGPSYQPPLKQARRGGNFGGRGGRYDDPYASRGRGGYGSYNGPPPPGVGYGGSYPGYDPNQPFAPPQQPIDANSIIENIQRLQELGAQMGIQMPGAGPLPKPVYSGVTSSAPAPQRRREPCRDYETKGFCSRGNKCQYDHGNGSVFVPSFVAPPGDEYDPKNAAMGMTEHPGQPVKPQDMAAFRVPSANRHDKKQKRKARRSSFSAEGPNNDKTNTRIVVENIPEEKFTEDAVREFFTEFGTVDEISLRPSTNTQRRVATVKFDSWAAANAAWKSPKVVFDNRFVKIYWYKDESQLGSNAKKANGSKKGSANGGGTPAEPEFDMEEFKRRQDEAQKAHLEKQEKRETLERERQELEEKRRELLARQEEEKQKLQAKLAANGVKEDSPSPILTKLTTYGAKSSQAEALRAKLAALEQEANSLGLDPDAAADDSSWAPQGGRGRPYRGRGTYVPRSFRGAYGYRGRGGVGPDIHAAYASYSLDNRPKIIAITGADFTEPAKDEALRQYLFGIGEFSDIVTDSAGAHITFKDRKTAEQFMFGVSTNNTIPGIEGAVELSWATSAPKSAAAETVDAADGDLPMASGIEEEQAAKESHEVDENSAFGHADARDQGDMDYEGGDWDIQ